MPSFVAAVATTPKLIYDCKDYPSVDKVEEWSKQTPYTILPLLLRCPLYLVTILKHLNVGGSIKLPTSRHLKSRLRPY